MSEDKFKLCCVPVNIMRTSFFSYKYIPVYQDDAHPSSSLPTLANNQTEKGNKYDFPTDWISVINQNFFIQAKSHCIVSSSAVVNKIMR